MERWRGRVALVTGASVGIGAAICRALVQHGLTVVGCARNHQQIEALAAELQAAPGSLTAIHCDLTQSAQIEALFADIERRFGGVDLCVNNAGLNFTGSLLDGDIAKWRTILEVNVLAVAHCAQLAVRSMRRRDATEGQVININSMSGHRVQQSGDVHFYAASKHAVKALTEGLRQELVAEKPNNIRVAQISPGNVHTEFTARMYGDRGLVSAGDSVGFHADNMADAVLYVLSAPPDVQIHDILLRPTAQPD